MKLVLVSRIDIPEALEYSRDLYDLLEAEGNDVVLEAGTAAALGRSGPGWDELSGDLMVVVGGDGTILRTVQQLPRQMPIVGINMGEVGFLADLEASAAPGFLQNLRSGFAIEERMRLCLSRNGKDLGVALNEALIVTSRPAKMLRFSIVVDGIVAESFRSDGLLISTPTGSTAYAMSAGGPIVDPRIEGFLLVPLAPYMLSSRPHLISSNRKVRIRLESSKPAHLVIDGQQSVDLGSSAELEVKRSGAPALFLDAGRNFFEKVDNKLRRL